MDFIKIFNICPVKDPDKRMKNQSADWEKIFAKETFDRIFRALRWKISLAELNSCVPTEGTEVIPPSAPTSATKKLCVAPAALGSFYPRRIQEPQVNCSSLQYPPSPDCSGCGEAIGVLPIKEFLKTLAKGKSSVLSWETYLGSERVSCT